MIDFNGRKDKNFHILIIGSGVVGLATGKGFAKRGHIITYVDVNRERIQQLNAQGMSAMTVDEVDWQDIDIVMLTVSTPSINGRIVLDHIESAALDIGRGLAMTDKFVIVVVRSTVQPTTTEQRIAPIISQASGKQVGEGFGIAMNPEFLRQVSAVQDFDRPWITVLGTLDHLTANVLTELYKPFGGLISYCTPTEAEMIKYVNNIYNAVKISYFNEIHSICEQLNIDSNLVGAVAARSAEGMWNPLYGIRGGVPYGGACLPKDTTAFMTFCREQGWEHLMLEATLAINERLAEKVPAAESPDKIDGILSAIQQREMVSVNGDGQHSRPSQNKNLSDGNILVTSPIGD